MRPQEITSPPFLPAENKILIVDDDRANILILRSILRPAGYILADAGSGEEALAWCAQHHPDLVLLDVLMPGMDGFTTCRELHRREGDNAPPVIFITALSEGEALVAGFEAGGADYVTRPFRPNEILARIRTHLEFRALLVRQRLLVTQLRAANEAKNKFLGMAAHDLRNPLASIRGLSEFLRDGVVGTLNAEEADLVNTIHEASEGMLVLVNDLLDVTTIEAGELKLVLASAALVELVEKAVSLGNMEAARKRTVIVLATPGGGQGPVLPLDTPKMRQVVDNLLSNAVKFSPAGSTVTVALENGGGRCGFSVQDQGPGIPDNERHQLFKDFSRLSAQPTGGEKSTGLGLAICRKIVEAHGGTIAANNLPGRGCEFRVSLPGPPP